MDSELQRLNISSFHICHHPTLTIVAVVTYGSWVYNYLYISPLTFQLESRSSEVHSIQHYVIQIVNDLRQVCGFFHQSKTAMI